MTQDMRMKALIALALVLFLLGPATAADEAPTFHGIKLGVSLSSQFQECPRNPPKEGDIPEHIDTPFRDEKGNTIPCFFRSLPYIPATYPIVEIVKLIKRIALLKDEKGKVLPRQPRPGLPVVYVRVLVPASAQLDDGTIEEVALGYMPL